MKTQFCLLAALLVLGCTGGGEEEKDANLVEVGDTISVNYIGRVGTEVFDTSIESAGKAAGLGDKPYAPLSFKVGAGHMIEGFDSGVVWMRKGETKEIIIPPEKAYGAPNPELLKVFPMRDDQPMEPGMSVEFSTQGQSIRGVVREINGTHMLVDFNHRLAGQTLTFEVTVVDIQKA